MSVIATFLCSRHFLRQLLSVFVTGYAGFDAHMRAEVIGHIREETTPCAFCRRAFATVVLHARFERRRERTLCSVTIAPSPSANSPLTRPADGLFCCSSFGAGEESRLTIFARA